MTMATAYLTGLYSLYKFSRGSSKDKLFKLIFKLAQLLLTRRFFLEKIIIYFAENWPTHWRLCFSKIKSIYLFLVEVIKLACATND